MSDNRVEIELELSDEAIAMLDSLSKERGITRDDLVNEILREEMKKYEKRIFQEELIGDKFDEVLSDVTDNKTKYFICDDKELNHPVAVLMSMEEYQHLVNYQ